MCSVYVLYSEKLQRSYVGCSTNVEERLRAHNAKQVHATRAGVPWQLVYVEAAGMHLEARRRERYYKSGAGRRRLKSIFETWRGGRVV